MDKLSDQPSAIFLIEESESNVRPEEKTATRENFQTHLRRRSYSITATQVFGSKEINPLHSASLNNVNEDMKH